MKKIILKLVGIIIFLVIIVVSILYVTKSFEKDNINNKNISKIEDSNIINTIENYNVTDKVENNNSIDKEVINKNNTPVETYGKLSVKGLNIVDKNNQIFQLKGISTHGVQWFPEYVNKETFRFMRDNWEINVVRLAMYTDKSAGYSENSKKIVEEGIDYATELGLYVIVDWHILTDNNPNINKEDAKKFFIEIANKYKNNENIIYEICNEPNGNVTWDNDIKPYAQEVIKEIRKIDKNSIIICGTPNWSQDVDIVAKNPITEYDNIIYALHFYAATHKQSLRDKAQNAMNMGLPIIVSEFSICDASGNGDIDYTQANEWMKFLNDKKIGWVAWNLSNKNETSAILSSNTSKTNDWNENELSEFGKWLINNLK